MFNVKAQDPVLVHSLLCRLSAEAWAWALFGSSRCGLGWVKFFLREPGGWRARGGGRGRGRTRLHVVSLFCLLIHSFSYLFLLTEAEAADRRCSPTKHSLSLSPPSERWSSGRRPGVIPSRPLGALGQHSSHLVCSMPPLSPPKRPHCFPTLRVGVQVPSRHVVPCLAFMGVGKNKPIKGHRTGWVDSLAL
ncbi:hypothetical protein LZ30DRAFT_338468 [Colletotrichum cereale]|nr:hypothetical protein LZ30DRAFT_338468 [Colletotrichum cereale]